MSFKGSLHYKKMKNNNPTLLQKISNPESLKDAWKKLTKFNKESHGLSGETISSFDQNLDDKILSISERLKKGTYNFSKTRGVLISKKGKNSFRPLQIPEISDRVVIKAIAMELETIFDYILSKSIGYSFAYQKRLGVKDALMKIKEHYDDGNKYILEADLVNFFGTVDKKDLLDKQIFPNLPDDSINDLINDAMNQEIGNLADFDKSKVIFFNGVDKGIPQGNALSPLFSNIYLSDFDQKIINDKFNLVRYADDFVIVASTKRQCREAYKKCFEYLKELKLQIHPLEKMDKTKITDIENETVTFLSVTFDGKQFYPSQENFEKLQNKIWELLKGKKELNLFEFISKLKNKHDGWISAFIYTDLSRYFEELDITINRVFYIKLEKLDWKLKEHKLAKIPKKYQTKTSTNFCISETQRKNSGILSTQNIVEEKLKKIAEDKSK